MSMTLSQQVVAAFLLDLVLGDPRWLPHPVRGIGWLATRLESITRRCIRSPFLAGTATAAGVLAMAGGLAALLVCDDDKLKFNWCAAEFADRLQRYCPVTLQPVEEMD
ncbi:MAG: hypothetical protein EOM63_01195 [Clostridia bacterium]|nr:hypothetical protein [Clostridia bacterium]